MCPLCLGDKNVHSSGYREEIFCLWRLWNCFKERSRVFPAPIILSNFFSLKVKMSRYYILGWCVLNSVKSIYLQILLNVYFQSPTSKMGSSKCEWRFGNKLWWVAPSCMLAAPGTTQNVEIANEITLKLFLSTSRW